MAAGRRVWILNQNGQEIVAIFPISEAEAVVVASDSEKVRCLAELVLHSSIEARVNSAAVIEMVVVGTRSSDLRAQISSVDEIHEGVVEMLRNPIPYPQALKVGIKVLFALCLAKQTRHKAVAAF
ncbi:hypothetical protein LINPERPRIM_LOCUS29367 [Linum perenne]